MAGPRLTDEVFARLERDSFALIPSFLPPQQLTAMRAAIERIHPPFGSPEREPGAPSSVAFPYPEDALNDSIVDHEVIDFAARWFGTDDIRYKSGGTLVRYGPEAEPAALSPDEPPPEKDCHIDNFSLLPATEDRTHKLLFFWYILSDCDEAGNPTRVRGHGEVPDPAVEDVDEDGVPIRPHDVTGVVRAGKDVEFVAPAGSLAIFTNHSKRILDLIAFAVWLTRRFRYQHCTGATSSCGAAASATSSSTALAEPTTRGRARVATHSPAAGRSSGGSSLRSRRASAASSTSRRQETSTTRPTRSPRSSANSPAGTTAASTPRFRPGGPAPPDR